MTALRLVGTFFLVVCGWCAGDAVCIRTQEHLEALRQTIALLEEIEQEITFRRADLNMLSKKLQREHKLFCSAKMIQTAIPPQSFSPQEAACFAECFSALGHTEAEQACSRLAFYQERFRSFLQQQEKAAQSRPETRDTSWTYGSHSPFLKRKTSFQIQGGNRAMEIDLIFKIAAIGIIVAVLNQLLIRSGREDQAMMTTLAGLVVVLSILVKQISALFVTIKSLFAL